MNNIIVGRSSNLSNKISLALPDAKLLSARRLLTEPEFLDEFDLEQSNIIFNAFWPATQLNDTSEPERYISQSIMATAKMLNSVKVCNIKKFIYTSSASVYGNHSFCEESEEPMPLSLHASLKVANERLVQSFCTQNNIPYVIVRLFNMFGGEDKFSVVAKLLNAAKYQTEFTAVNDGRAARDFVHIDDVVDCYLALLNNDFFGTVNIASGLKTSVAQIIAFLSKQGITLQVKSLKKHEIACSVASVKVLSQLVDVTKFNTVEDYLLDQLKNCKPCSEFRTG